LRNSFAGKEETDHPLGPGQLFGIFAKGQTEGERKWIVSQAFETAANQNRTFYRNDEFTYHGYLLKFIAIFNDI
jgi:hypothetical protein